MQFPIANPLIRVMYAFFSEIPILGIFSSYVFHPVWLVTRSDGSVVMRMEKQPAFFEGKFAVERKGALTELEEQRVLLSLIMMLLLERTRGSPMKNEPFHISNISACPQ